MAASPKGAAAAPPETCPCDEAGCFTNATFSWMSPLYAQKGADFASAGSDLRKAFAPWALPAADQPADHAKLVQDAWDAAIAKDAVCLSSAAITGRGHGGFAVRWWFLLRVLRGAAGCGCGGCWCGWCGSV